MNVDAYIVDGMTTPFILAFGDTGREIKVENSTAPPTVDLEGHVFKVRILPEKLSRLNKYRTHRWVRRIV